MNSDIYYLIMTQLRKDAVQLATHFQVETEIAEQIIPDNRNLEMLARPKKSCQLKTDERCQARVWNNAKGGQCTRCPTEGSEFCQTHAGLKYPKWCKGCFQEFGENRFHQYVWEHLGRISDQPPSCFAYAEQHRHRRTKRVTSS